MAKDFEFKGIWIPARIFTDARLTQTDKFLFGVIHILCNERGCFATRETLAEYMSQSVRNTQYSISRLLDCGYVRKDENDVLWDIITHTIDRGEKPFTGGVKVSAPKGRKKLHPLSIDRNKDINEVIDTAPEVFVSDAFIRSDSKLAEAWDKWLAHRRGKRWATNNEYIERWNTVFADWGAEKATKSLESSLLQGWQGLFEPKGVTSTRTLAPKGDTDHAKGF
jgi:hypothetical protein